MSATKSVEKTFIKHLNFEPKQYFSFNLKSLNLSKSIVLNDLALLLKSKHCSVPLNSMMISKKRCMSKSVKNFFFINRSYLECSRNRDQKQQTFLRTHNRRKRITKLASKRYCIIVSLWKRRPKSCIVAYVFMLCVILQSLYEMYSFSFFKINKQKKKPFYFKLR